MDRWGHIGSRIVRWKVEMGDKQAGTSGVASTRRGRTSLRWAWQASPAHHLQERGGGRKTSSDPSLTQNGVPQVKHPLGGSGRFHLWQRQRSASWKEDPTSTLCMTLKGCAHMAPWPFGSICLRARHVITNNIAEQRAAGHQWILDAGHGMQPSVDACQVAHGPRNAYHV
jgi:hypothetical protein